MRNHMKDEETGLALSMHGMRAADAMGECRHGLLAGILGPVARLVRAWRSLSSSMNCLKHHAGELEASLAELRAVADSLSGRCERPMVSGGGQGTSRRIIGSKPHALVCSSTSLRRRTSEVLVGEDGLAAACKGYEGLIAILKQDEHGLVLPDICIGTSAGDYEHYVTRPKTSNDLHGVGAFVMACVEMEEVHALMRVSSRGIAQA